MFARPQHAQFVRHLTRPAASRMTHRFSHVRVVTAALVAGPLHLANTARR